MSGCFLTHSSAKAAESVPADPGLFSILGGVLSPLWLLCLFSASWCQCLWYYTVLVFNWGGQLPFAHFCLQERIYVRYISSSLLFHSLPKIV